MTQPVTCLGLLLVACGCLPSHTKTQIQNTDSDREQDVTGNIIDHAKDEAVNSVDDYLEKDVTELDVSLALKILKTDHTSRRTKRALGKALGKAVAFFGQKTLAFIIGRRAQAFLLSGAVKSKTIVEHARTLIQYTKPGGFTKARSDFHSVEPTDVIDIKPLCDGGKGKLGYVGDRTIKLINCETDQMVKVIITRFDKNDKKLVHAITYN